MKPDSGQGCALVCFLGLPLLAIGIFGYLAYQAATISGGSPFVFVPVGLVFGLVIVGAAIASSGHDMMDFAVSSIIVIVLTLILLRPIFIRARENAHRRAIQKALRAKVTPTPTTKKAPQPVR